MNICSLFFSIEREFHFTFEANVDYLSNPTPANLELFFKNQNATFSFGRFSKSLEFGEGIIEEYRDEAESNQVVSLDKKILINKQYLTILDYKTDKDPDQVIEAYCHYADLLVKRKQERDLEEADKIISICLDTKCRKDHFEFVGLVHSSVFLLLER